MDYFPFFLKFEKQRVLIVGGGDIALRKARLLLKAGALINVVAPEITEAFKVLLKINQPMSKQYHDQTANDQEKNEHHWYQKEYTVSDLEGVCFVIAATDNYAVNAVVAQEAKAQRLWVNVVDAPALCSAITPAIIDRNPLVIAVASMGKAPVLVRRFREKLESMIPHNFGVVGEWIGKHRAEVKSKCTCVNGPRKFWESMLDGQAQEFLLNGKTALANDCMKNRLDLCASCPNKNVDTKDGVSSVVCNKDQSNALPLSSKKAVGEVYIVGAGPGDPDLLSFKAVRLMQQADVVLHDRLVPDGILELIRRDADRLYVGKEKSNHAIPQDKINETLVSLARQGKRVCRLKGGDPYIFGRGGEEAQSLAEHNISFQVIPGITAASGCSTYAGIPLTHRDYAHSVRFITGYFKNGYNDVPWASYATDGMQTLVVYMGVDNISFICQQLIKHGMKTSMPIALIQQGTQNGQAVYTGIIETFPRDIQSLNIESPALIIIGQVVQLHETLGL